MAEAKDAGVVAGWSAVAWLARRLPERAARAAFVGLADGLWYRRGGAVRQLERNLTRVLGADEGHDAARRLSKQAMRSYARYWLEAFRLPDWTAAEVTARATVANWSAVTAAVRERGAVVALPHMGNWDLAGAWAAANGVPVTAVAERLEPPTLFERFASYRRQIGIEVLPLGDADVLDALVERATEHRLVTLLADRAFGSAGIEVELFDEPLLMPAGAATLAVRAGVPLFPVTLWYDELARVWVHDPVQAPADAATERGKVTAMTQAVARVFEEAIRAHPTDWHMLQRIWLTDRTPRAGTQPPGGTAA